MIRSIDGIKYLMRDTRPTSELRELHKAFEAKYGQIDFHRWLAERGKVHIQIKRSNPMYTKSSVKSYAQGREGKKSYKRNIVPFGSVGASAAMAAVSEGVKDLWRKGKRSKLAKRLHNPDITIQEAYKRLKSVGWIVVPTDTGIDISNSKRLQRTIKYQDSLGSLVDASTVNKYVVEGQNRIKNPGSKEPISPEVEDLAKEWHGRDVRDITEIDEQESFETDLVELGDLEELGILDFGKITFKKDQPKLACDGEGHNLEIVGGDSRLDLDNDGIKYKEKRLVPLGYLVSIVYITDKFHLEGSNGYPEPYEHYFCEDYYKKKLAIEDFGEDTEAWFEELQDMGVVADAVEKQLLPLVVYDKTDERILIVGGKYTVTELGIKD